MAKITQNFPADNRDIHSDESAAFSVPSSCNVASEKGTTMSRREIFPSVLATPVAIAALPTIGDPAAAQEYGHLDAELIALGRMFEAAHTEVIAYGREHDGYPDDYVMADSEIAEKMINVPAKTVDGLKVKVRALFTYYCRVKDEQWFKPETWEYEDVDEGLMLSLIEDVMKM